MGSTVIDPSDKVLIEKLRIAIAEELKLVPAYDDDLSLLRWIVGWDRKIGLFIISLASLFFSLCCKRRGRGGDWN